MFLSLLLVLTVPFVMGFVFSYFMEDSSDHDYFKRITDGMRK